MNLSRRAFFQGALALAGASMVVSPLRAFTPLRPILWGDGIHDDAPALQAMLDGLPADIRADGASVVGSDTVILRSSAFRLASGLVVKNGRMLKVESSYLRFEEFDEPGIYVRDGGILHAERCMFDGASNSALMAEYPRTKTVESVSPRFRYG